MFRRSDRRISRVIGRVPRLPTVLSSKSVWLALLGWAAVNAALLTIGSGRLPFHASKLADAPTLDVLVQTNLMYLEVFALMGVVHLMTRRRTVPNIADRAPVARLAAVETAGLLAYGVLVMSGGALLARVLGFHAFGFHLEGMVMRTGHPVVPLEALLWAAYNLVAYVVVPLLYFRSRYSGEQLGLRSSDRRADALLIAVVLVVESAVQLSLNPAIFGVSARQFLLGAPLTLALSLAGTALPTMVFVACILLPRYLRLTGSVPATVILGGVTYAALHITDGWTSFSSPTDAVLSVMFVFLYYAGPGMFKSFITIRSANSWVHMWAYHAIAPHTLMDTPMFVRVFGIR